MTLVGQLPRRGRNGHIAEVLSRMGSEEMDTNCLWTCLYKT